MSQYELIAFDMDGTLLNSQKEITPRTLAALKKAAAAGKQIALSTGRCRPELTAYTALVPGIRYFICTSGALVYDVHEQKEIYKKYIIRRRCFGIVCYHEEPHADAVPCAK